MKRRDFLQRSLLAGAGSLLGPFANLPLAQAAMRGSKALPDFKALVCVFQYGGNDAFNMVVPSDASTHAVYAASRGHLTIARDQVLALNPVSAPAGGGTYGLHPSMTGVQSLFNTGHCAVVGNLGPLLYPITKSELDAGSVPTPPQLFSHSDQQFAWETAWSDSQQKTGWAGRVADCLLDANPIPGVSTCISLAGANTLQVGDSVQPYFMDTGGGDGVFFIEGDWHADRRAAFDAIRALAARNDAHVFERQYAGVMQRALDTQALVQSALDAHPFPNTVFPDTYLGLQLRMVARMIAARSTLGMSRQIFLVYDGGYDTHDNQLADHADLLGNLSGCLRAFYDATVELGVANAVTAFTASEFGRTVTVNGDGTDHGWGSHHLVVGGAVQGRRFYGTMPDLTSEGPQDAGWGQIIPTTSVDQYAATLARWFGVSASNISDIVVPNIGRFASADLGFLG